MVVLLVLVGLIVVGMAVAGRSQQDLSVKRLGTVRAFYAAEAGMNMAIREVVLGVDEDGDGTVGGIAPKAIAQFGGASVAVAATSAGSTTTLVSVGTTTDTRRRIATQLASRIQASSALYPGLVASYFISAGSPALLADINWNVVPDAAAVVDDVNWPATGNSEPFWFSGPSSNYGARFAGYIEIPQSGTWTFYTMSDEGSTLWVNGVLVVDNDGLHAMQTRSGTIELGEGWQTFEVFYFERTGNHGLIASWSGPGVASQTVIPAGAFAHAEHQLVQPTCWLAVRETISLSGGQVRIDGFNSAAGMYGGGNVQDTAYVATNSTQSGAINVSSSTIHGHARVGPGGNHAAGITPANANITGSRDALLTNVTLAQAILPANIPDSSGNISHGGNSNTTYSADFRSNNFTMSNSAQVNIAAPVVGRIDGSFSMRNNSSINITDNGRLTLFVYGDFSMAQSAVFNINTGDPARVRIYMMGENRGISLSNQAKLVAQVENPRGPASFDNSSEHFGTLFARTLNMSHQSRIHVDARTREGDASVSSQPGLASWTETAPQGP
jgi:hypothetical protein